MTPKTAKRAKGLPGTYAELVAMFPLLAVHDEVAYDNALEMADVLTSLAVPTADQEAYLEVLVMLIEAYERDRYAIPAAKPLEVLKSLLADHGLSASDLGRLLGDRTYGPKILKGQRQLSKANMVTLGKRFGVPAGLFL